ncbi:hypothetical protein KC318_g183 [Hortaea werneckii]|nr:hypothetical protein KC334_g194 [Hortaea werneckii]KAI7027864.1 hypothetical protein KC355_g184 [Hortaea werneckii]KAI7676573.1 hypothetical protein KC318_g183 [Hortaea werneckii]
MPKPTNGRSSSPFPSSNTSGRHKGVQSITSDAPPAPSGPQTSQPDDHTDSIVEGDWVAITSSSVPGSEAPGDLSASMSVAHDTLSVPRSVDQGTVDPEDQGEHEGYASGEDDMGADGEENMVGKLAARLAEMGSVVQGEEDVMELVERELRAYGVDLGIEREGKEEEDGKEIVERKGN